jgi:wobble nucleotide-excising tRNase
MIHKISTIENMGLFKQFNWNNTVKDHSGNVISFKKMNIIYGRNYSGKTTLSRIFRAIEKEQMPKNYEESQFVIDSESELLNLEKAIEKRIPVRVYNRDFIQDNLKFVIDDSQDIESFAILGDSNIRIEEALEANSCSLLRYFPIPSRASFI